MRSPHPTPAGLSRRVDHIRKIAYSFARSQIRADDSEQLRQSTGQFG
jgi:hypothetical protein